jgi:hypothetical protein
MQPILDILASGVHDAKNQLLLAESLIADAEKRHGIDLGETRYAIEAAAGRLSRRCPPTACSATGAAVAVPVIVADLCDEVALDQRRHLVCRGIALDVRCTVLDEWPLDRELIGDLLNNAVQNAGATRAAGAAPADEEDGWLVLRVRTTGPGYATRPPPPGVGLLVAGKLAALHRRRERSGSVELANGGEHGGAVFTVRLP